jgi:hypothetical protein
MMAPSLSRRGLFGLLAGAVAAPVLAKLPAAAAPATFFADGLHPTCDGLQVAFRAIHIPPWGSQAVVIAEGDSITWMLPRTPFSASRAAFNAALRSWEPRYDALVDFASDSMVGAE